MFTAMRVLEALEPLLPRPTRRRTGRLREGRSPCPTGSDAASTWFWTRPGRALWPNWWPSPAIRIACDHRGLLRRPTRSAVLPLRSRGVAGLGRAATGIRSRRPRPPHRPAARRVPAEGDRRGSRRQRHRPCARARSSSSCPDSRGHGRAHRLPPLSVSTWKRSSAPRRSSRGGPGSRGFLGQRQERHSSPLQVLMDTRWTSRTRKENGSENLQQQRVTSAPCPRTASNGPGTPP